MKRSLLAFLFASTATAVFAAGHGMEPLVIANDQSVENGIVSAETVAAGENGWLVVHRTDAEMKPGPVVGHAPLRAGENTDVAAILTEEVAPGEMLMLMVHGETGGTTTGIFEYTLGAKEDGPIKVDGNLVMSVITAQ
jgi:hypothetical protein